MRYQLKPISKENWRTAAQLRVAPHQKNLIEDNRDSLLEAAYDTELQWTPIGLYVNHQMVGFSMIGAENTVEHSIWLDRFMIDETHQHQGYGHALFRVVLNYLKDHYKHVHTIYLSVHQENEKAFPFYESFGFENTHETDPKNGEIIMRCTIIRD
ncbi:GNAT family N-acetyltransferase [Enterococcus saccharolyticus]|uniref:GNAT family N-acetyltransferase n=1 Tax=Enterococcus TaxID=1350 RepID=UPI001E656468|nr:GNAT family N-acetyltransferase [Enterococcus saccharolyticus]MCD5001628.1 GNAT family N-acetyltransferase [Enterococcus saccharolyticus]